MSNASTQSTPNKGINKMVKSEENKIIIFAKTDWPKTPKYLVKSVAGIVLNFIG